MVEAEPGTIVRTVPGRVSDTFTPVYRVLVGFRSVMVNVVVPPGAKLGGSNAFVTPRSCTRKRAVAEEGFVRFCAFLRAPAGIVLRYEPRVLEMTSTRIVQVEFGAISALVKETEPPDALKEADGPQLVKEDVTGVATVTPVGRESASAAWVSVVLGSGLVMLMVNVLR